MALAMALTNRAIKPWAGRQILKASRLRQSRRRKRSTGLNTGTCFEDSASGPAEPARNLLDCTTGRSDRLALLRHWLGDRLGNVGSVAGGRQVTRSKSTR